MSVKSKLNNFMTYWSRENTKDWINQVELRLEDMNFYLSETVRYCEHRGITDNIQVLVLSIMTCIWVSTMRNESITMSEVADILGIEGLSQISEKTYSLGNILSVMDFEEMLDTVSTKGPYF